MQRKEMKKNQRKGEGKPTNKNGMKRVGGGMRKRLAKRERKKRGRLQKRVTEKGKRERIRDSKKGD